MTKKLDTKKSQAIVLGLVTGLLVIYFYLSVYKEKDADGLLIATMSIAVLSALFGKVAYYLALVWMKFGLLLGKINGAILLTLVYILVVTPIAWLKKLFGANPNFKASTESSSAFDKRNKTFSKEDIQLPW
ncbi:SxtJ family membrane protein [Roseivirga sp. 4D4]|uniref:SxtJ family membrane protein n=1 Tax=Roseivirga sp. 4D4 TaxID=1889784 RepID=UPI001112FFCF|nr:SxtJ family membrane protein [Roseivirga sp. 4D4]